VLWLASVRDAFSNKVVGWATDARADTELVLTALNHALRSRNIQDGQLVHHSDKGCQYTALRFTQRLADAGVAPSTGSVGDSYDPVVAVAVAKLPDSGQMIAQKRPLDVMDAMLWPPTVYRGVHHVRLDDSPSGVLVANQVGLRGKQVMDPPSRPEGSCQHATQAFPGG
jgi:transposase InsO family protein